MANPTIIDYLQKNSANYSLDMLKGQLLQGGYKQEDIDEAVSQLDLKPIPPAPMTPAPTVVLPTADNLSPIKKRGPMFVIILSIVTIGIYAIYWVISTTNELHKNTKSCPSSWILLLFFVPFVNFFAIIYYHWKYCKAVNELTGFSNVQLFISLLFYPLFQYWTQAELNKKA